MNRRTLLGRFAAAVAAVAVAPVVQSEAAPQDAPVRDQTGLYTRDGEWRMAVNGRDVGSVQSVIDSERSDARAEGYNRGHDVASERAESRALDGADRTFPNSMFDVHPYHEGDGTVIPRVREAVPIDAVLYVDGRTVITGDLIVNGRIMHG